MALLSMDSLNYWFEDYLIIQKSHSARNKNVCIVELIFGFPPGVERHFKLADSTKTFLVPVGVKINKSIGITSDIYSLIFLIKT